jgi:signal transduction histidine kinase
MTHDSLMVSRELALADGDLHAEVARIVHDVLVPGTSSLTLRLHLAAEEAPAEHAGFLTEIAAELVETVDRTRCAVRALAPDELGARGLHGALESMAQRVEGATGRPISVERVDYEEPSELTGLVAYRLARRTLLALSAHAGVALEIRGERGGVELTFSGPGASLRSSDELWQQLQGRAEHLAGSFSLTPGSGLLRLSLPALPVIS